MSHPQKLSRVIASDTDAERGGPPSAAFPATARVTLATQALIITCGFVICRLAAGAFTGLGIDESYTLAVSHGWALSYFDHPPLHQWIVHVGALMFGWGPGARLPFIALSAVTSWLMFRLTRRLFGAAAGVWATLALNLSGFFTAVAGSWLLPDGPLNLFLLATALAVYEVSDPEKTATAVRTWTGWLAAGLFLGLAALSKYQALPFAAGLALFLATDRDLRRWLRHPAPWAAAALCLLVASPVLIWNADHGWVSFRFQGGRGAPQRGLHPLAPLLALLGQAGLLFPWIFAPLVVATGRAAVLAPAQRPHRFCLMLAAPTIIIFTLIPLWSGGGLPHWSMPGWLLLFPLLGDLLARAARARSWPRAWALGSIIAVALLWTFSVTEVATGWLGREFPKAMKVDPTAESIEWTGLRTQVARRLGSPSTCLFITATGWADAGKISQAVGDLVPVQVFGQDPRGFAFIGSAARPGCDSLIVGRSSKIESALPGLRPYFGHVRPFAQDYEGRGAPEIALTVLEAGPLLRTYPTAYPRAP